MTADKPLFCQPLELHGCLVCLVGRHLAFKYAETTLRLQVEAAQWLQ